MAANLKRSASDAIFGDRPPKRVAENTRSNTNSDPNERTRWKNGASVSHASVMGEASPLDELIAISGDLSIARLYEEYAKQEVDRCVADQTSSEKFNTFPSFVELRTTALNTARETLSYRQENVRSLTARAKQYREAFDREQESRENLLITNISEKIATSVEVNIRSALQRKDQDIETLKTRLETNDEETSSQIIVLKKEIETLKIVIGNFKRITNDHVQQSREGIEQCRADFGAKLATITVEVHTATASCHAVDLQIAALSKELEKFKASTTDFSISWAAAMSKMGQQFNDAFRRIEILHNGHDGLKQQVRATNDHLTNLQVNIELLLKNSDISSNTELKEMQAQITQIRHDIGKAGDDDNTEPSGLWGYIIEQLGSSGNEDGLGRNGLWGYLNDVGYSGREDGNPTGLFAAVKQLQDDLSSFGNNDEVQQRFGLLVTHGIEGLSNQFDDIIKELVHKQNKTLSGTFAQLDTRITPCLDAVSTFNAFEKEAEAQFVNFENKLLALTEQFHSLRQQLDNMEISSSEIVVLPENIRQKPPTSLLKASANIFDIKYADMKTEIEVVAEACRSLEDRYNNTTSETIVQAMCHEMNARFGFQIYVNQVTANTQAIGKVHSDFAQLKQQLGILGDDLAGRLPQTERSHHEQRNSIAELIRTNSARDSSMQHFQDFIKKDTNEFQAKLLKTVTSQREIFETVCSSMKKDLDSFGTRTTALEQSKAYEIMSTEMSQRVCSMDNRVGDLETQFENVEKRVAAIESNRTLEIEETKRKFTTLSNQISNTNGQVASRSDLLTLSDTTQHLVTELAQIQNGVIHKTDLVILSEEIKSFEAKITQLQSDVLQVPEVLALRNALNLLESKISQLHSDLTVYKQTCDKQAADAREQQMMFKPTNILPGPSIARAVTPRERQASSKSTKTPPRLEKIAHPNSSLDKPQTRLSRPTTPQTTIRDTGLDDLIKYEGPVAQTPKRGPGRPRKDTGKEKEESKGRKTVPNEMLVRPPRTTVSLRLATPASSPPRAASEEL